MRFPIWLMAVLVLVTGVTLAARADDAPLRIAGSETVGAERVLALIGAIPNLVIIDSRKPEDFAAGAIEGAVLLTDTDMTQQALSGVVASRDTPVLFYCNGVKCGRAAKAVGKAVEWGYTRVYYYALGITEWDRLGLPLVVADRARP